MKKIKNYILVFASLLTVFTMSACFFSETTTKVDYLAPVVSFDSETNKLSFSSSQATAFESKLDDGEWASASDHEFSSEVGAHELKVRVKADDANSIAEATYAYETKKVSITVQSSDLTVSSVTYVGTKAEVNVGAGYVNINTVTLPFTAPSKVQVPFKVFGGFDTESKIYYVAGVNGYSEYTYLLVEEGSSESVILPSGLSNAQLAGAIKSYKYENSSWVDASCTITATTVDDKACAQLGYWDKYVSYKYEADLSNTKAFDAITFDYKGNGISTVKIQLGISDPNNEFHGVYLTYNLGVLPNAWVHYVLRFDDANWKLNFAGNDYTVSQLASRIGMSDLADLAGMFNKFRILLYGETPNYGSAKAWISNIKFENVAENTPTKSATTPVTITFADGIEGSKYSKATWKQEMYGNSGWETKTDQMNCRKRYDVLLSNFTTAYKSDYRYTYSINGGAVSMGSVNKVSAWFGNDFDGSSIIKVKILLVDSSQNVTYVAGSSSSYVDIPAQSTLTEYNYTCSTVSDVRAVVIIVKATSQSSQYLYCSKIALSNVTE